MKFIINPRTHCQTFLANSRPASSEEPSGTRVAITLELTLTDSILSIILSPSYDEAYFPYAVASER